MTFPLWEQSASTLTGLKQSSDADFKARTEKQEEIKSELAAAGITGNSGSFELGDPNYCDIASMPIPHLEFHMTKSLIIGYILGKLFIFSMMQTTTPTMITVQAMVSISK